MKTEEIAPIDDRHEAHKENLKKLALLLSNPASDTNNVRSKSRAVLVLLMNKLVHLAREFCSKEELDHLFSMTCLGCEHDFVCDCKDG